MKLKKKKLQDELSQQWFLMLYSLYAFEANQDDETLHKLRVEIKKIRTTVYLVEKCSGPKKLSPALAPLKKMFRDAGRIRELQLHNQLTKKKDKGQVKTLVKKFVADTNLYASSIQKTFDVYIHVFDDLNFKDIKKLLITIQDKTAKLLASETAWHEARKEIKRLVYIGNLLPKKLRKKTSLDLSYYKQLEETIGTWHDLDLSIRYLDKMGVKDKSLPEKKTAMVNKVKQLAQSFNVD